MAGQRSRPRSNTERAEWAFGILSGATVLAIVGYLVWQGLIGGRGTPDLAVAASPSAPDASQLRFTLTNRGGQAATAVAVALTLGDGRRIVARRRLVVDLVPAGSEVEGGFLLTPDDAGLTPMLTVEGYLDP